MTQHQIITAVLDGTLFGMVECDVCVPGELQDHFAEMQPIFKNTMVVVVVWLTVSPKSGMLKDRN